MTCNLVFLDLHSSGFQTLDTTGNIIIQISSSKPILPKIVQTIVAMYAIHVNHIGTIFMNFASIYIDFV